MSDFRAELLFAEPRVADWRRDILYGVWRELVAYGDAGATTWDVLDGIQAEVTACLDLEPPDFDRAESLTAKAFLLRGSRDHY